MAALFFSSPQAYSKIISTCQNQFKNNYNEYKLTFCFLMSSAKASFISPLAEK